LTRRPIALIHEKEKKNPHVNKFPKYEFKNVPYICPQYWDMEDKIPLTQEEVDKHLRDGTKKMIDPDKVKLEVDTSKDGSKTKVGTIGHVGATSFFPSKNLGCYGDGGAIFTNDDALAHTIRGIVNHGMYIRYHHDVVGVNSRLDSVQAAVLNAKLPFLNEYNQARQNAARKYSAAFDGHKNIVAPSICDICDCHVFHQYTLRIIDADRDALMQHLLDNGIPCAIYYPIPLHLQKAYLDERYKEEDFPVTNQLVKEVISLPMHTELDDDQIQFITATVLEFLN
jgi:dTDP-4-amino-4,6-dideoxygalactose transaminase